MKKRKLETLKTFFVDVKIRFSEVDSLGILWHGNYVQYLEDCREQFGVETGLDYLFFQEQGYIVPVTKLDMDFKAYSRYGELLEVEMDYLKTNVAKICFNYIVREKATKTVVCTAYSEQVFVHKESSKLAIAKPKFLSNWEKTVAKSEVSA